MTRSAVALRAGAAPHFRLLRDATPVLLALALCPVGAALAPADVSAPLARAATIAGWERSLGLAVEPTATAWLHGRAFLAGTADLFYFWVHLPATMGVLVWTWLERRPAFNRVRGTFVATQAITVAVNALIPTAPPWMLAGGSEPYSGAVHVVQSPLAAMPSGHMAFATFVAGTLLVLVRSPLVRVAAVAYAVLVLGVIVATGNHFLFDGVAGAGVAAAGAAIARARR